jgi:hypothetical protein
MFFVLRNEKNQAANDFENVFFFCSKNDLHVESSICKYPIQKPTLEREKKRERESETECVFVC